MDEFWRYVIDVLSEFGSGAGDPSDEYVRFGLGSIFFALLLIIALRNRRGQLRTRETILAIGFALGLTRELFKFVVKSLELHGGVETATLELFFPPLEHALFALSRVFIATGFIHFFFDARRLADRFLLGGSVLVLGFYVVAAPIWWSIVAETPTAKFSHFIGDWVIHSFGTVIGVYLVGIFLLARKPGHLIVSAVFACFLLDDVLQLINLGTGEVYKSTFAPIRHNLHIWGIFVLGFLYLRELSNEKSRLEERLHHRERIDAVGQLAAGVAHDFNNILQVVLGFTEVARAKDNDHEDALNQVERAGKRGAELVNQLLTYSRQDRLIDGQCSVDKTIAGTVDFFQKLLGPEVTLKLELHAQDTWIDISESRLEQVIANLLVNARHAMPNGGEVSIRTAPGHVDLNARIIGTGKSDVVQIEVSDTGEGMSEETLKKAFTPFFTTKPVGEGTGLGLASVEGIVARANGMISATSALGHGTTIRIVLPISDKKTDTHKPAPEPVVKTGAKTILMAEDEPALAHLFSTYLRGAGYTVLTAGNGVEATQIAEDTSYEIDLCLFDVAMPEMDGYKAYAKIQKAGKPIPVVFMTGRMETKNNENSEYAHIAKPFDRQALLDLVAAQFPS